MAFLARGLQDTDLISQQTNGRLKTGTGIYKNFAKSTAQLEKEVEFDEALNYALPKWSEGVTRKGKVTDENPLLVTKAEMEKKQVLEWHLFKNGLILPQIENKSASECVLEGLHLISNSLLRKQDETLNSLQQVNEENSSINEIKKG